MDAFLDLNGRARRRSFAALLVLCATTSWAVDWPADAMVDTRFPMRTLVPKVIVDSGKLEWVPHDIDLTAFVTPSHLDLRPTPKPQKAVYTPPLNGDAKRGRSLVMDARAAACVTCHEVPGEQWPGNIGPSLHHYKMQQRTAAELYQQIFDVRVSLPQAVMPPFGTMGILSDQDIRDIVACLQTCE
jgi:L-cysteine S-thiosulfotransferase